MTTTSGSWRVDQPGHETAWYGLDRTAAQAEARRRTLTGVTLVVAWFDCWPYEQPPEHADRGLGTFVADRLRAALPWLRIPEVEA